MKFTVVNDGALTNETRLGAFGNIQFVIEQLQISDDLLILVGDNLFEFELSDFVKFSKESNSDALVMYYENDQSQLKRNGAATFDGNNVVNDFIEEPDDPTHNHSIPTFYVLKSSILPLIKQYLGEGNNPDAPGNFIPYLIGINKVKAFVFEENLYDIDTIESYNKVQEIFNKK